MDIRDVVPREPAEFSIAAALETLQLWNERLGCQVSCAKGADFAGYVRTRRSISGIVAVYAGSAVAWSSQLQWSVAMSTTEAEFIAASEGAIELLWLKRLLGELGGKGIEVPNIMTWVFEVINWCAA
jgi:hypothetical protein